MTPFQQINKKITYYEDDVQMNFAPTYAPSQASIISLIDNYWVSKYRDGSYDSLGFLKPFYNIVVNPTEVAAKMIDIDTKNINVIAENGASFYPAWFFSKELKAWMKEKKFAQLLNEIVYKLPKYGSVVIKKHGSDIDLVPLQNLINNPNVEKLEDDLIIEEHTETQSKFRDLAEEYGWENIDEAIELVAKGKDVTYYEAYGKFEDTKDNYHIVCSHGTELHSAKLSECPYREVHWDKIKGRWLGRGQVEKLFEAQVQQNKVSIYKSQSLHWTSKRIFQTRDDGVERNLMTDVNNGDILRNRSEITPIANEERNIHAYAEEESRWDQLIEKLGFSYDVVRGQRMPSGTTLGATEIAAAMAGGYFEIKREDIGIFLRLMILDWLIPLFKKERRVEHKIMITDFDDEELQKLRTLITQEKTNKMIIDYLRRSGQIPSLAEIEVFKIIIGEKVKKEKELIIPEGHYDNLKYRLDVNITGEQLNMAARLNFIQVVLQIIGSNPTLLQDPRTKKLMSQLMEAGGLSPIIQEEEPAGVAQLGGSLPKTMPASAAMLPTERTV